MRRRPAPPGLLQDLVPQVLLLQIVLVQVAFYVLAALVLFFSAAVWGHPVSPPLSLLLDWHILSATHTFGWIVGLGWVCNGIFCALPLLLIVRRSKLVLDFAVTAHFIHFLISAFYTGLVPRDVFFYLVMAVSTSAMTLAGVWACQWRELQPLSFAVAPRVESQSRVRNPASTPIDSQSEAATHLLRGGDIEMDTFRR